MLQDFLYYVHVITRIFNDILKKGVVQGVCRERIPYIKVNKKVPINMCSKLLRFQTIHHFVFLQKNIIA